MLRKTLLLATILISTGSVSGIDADITESCDGDFEPIASLENTEGGFVAEPDYYNENICVNNIEYSEIREICTSRENIVMSLESRSDTKISIYDNNYDYRICVPNIKSAVRDSCLEDETKVLSVESDNDSYAAAPGYTDSTFDQSFCLSTSSAENVSISLSGLEGTFYSNGSKIETGASITSPINYPYIVDDQPKGLVGYGDVIRISKTSFNTAKMTQKTDSGSFLVPFTKGGNQEILDEQEEILDRIFLNTVSPSFGFISVDEPELKVAYSPNRSLEGFSDSVRVNYNDLRIRNLGLQGNELKIDISIE